MMNGFPRRTLRLVLGCSACWLLLGMGLVRLPAQEKPALDKPAEAPASVATSSISIPDKLSELFAGGNPKSIDDLKAMEVHTKALSEKLIACTVGVQIGPAWGSGVVISKDGYVLTAAHVSGQPNRDVQFVFPDGKSRRGKSLGLNRSLDAGIMKINLKKDEDLPFAEMAPAGQLKEGLWCLATGHPGGYFPDRKPVLRLGRVLFYDREAVTTDCTLVGGDSGGPLFDMQGRVIGINSRISNELTSNMHVPIAAFRQDWDRMLKGDAWGHFPGQEPYIGVRGKAGVDNVTVASVGEGSPAEQAGLKEGDVIQKFDGQDLTDFASLAKMVQDRQPGERIKLKVKRGEEDLDLAIVIGRKGR